MEASTTANGGALLGGLIQTLIGLGIIAGLIYGARKSKVFRIILIVFLALLMIAAVTLFAIFKDYGQGWAL